MRQEYLDAAEYYTPRCNEVSECPYTGAREGCEPELIDVAIADERVAFTYRHQCPHPDEIIQFSEAFILENFCEGKEVA